MGIIEGEEAGDGHLFWIMLGVGLNSSRDSQVLCTWQLLVLGVKEPWLAPGGAILVLAA